VNKNILIFLILILFNNCSFDTKSGIWTQEKKLTEIKQENKKIKELFKQNIIDENEFNKDLIVKFVNDKKIRANINQNNLGVSELSLRLDKLLKYKFSKIEYFDQFEPDYNWNKFENVANSKF